MTHLHLKNILVCFFFRYRSEVPNSGVLGDQKKVMAISSWFQSLCLWKKIFFCSQGTGRKGEKGTGLSEPMHVGAAMYYPSTIPHLSTILMMVLCNAPMKSAFGLTSAWKDETEKMPSRPSANFEGRLAAAKRLFGFGSSPPCKLAR